MVSLIEPYEVIHICLRFMTIKVSMFPFVKSIDNLFIFFQIKQVSSNSFLDYQISKFNLYIYISGQSILFYILLQVQLLYFLLNDATFIK